ncbi:MAG: site-specific integrase [Phycisphaerae bacterium]|nr:site-specific integrase [Phycisphaerae bacterium]
MANASRFFFVSREIIDVVINACPDMDWKLTFALARYGGLRCPSEIYRLNWQDIHWDEGYMLVHSPKTEHHGNKGMRKVPLFPVIMPLLLEAFNQAADGQTNVISKYNRKNQNLRTQATRIIKKAGIEPWQKIFQNCRSSRETELLNIYPVHQVCSWLGNSPAVAMKHYAQITDNDYLKAAGIQQVEKKSGHNSGQSAFAGHRLELTNDKTDLHKLLSDNGFGNNLQELTNPCNDKNLGKMGPVGLEPTTQRL